VAADSGPAGPSTILIAARNEAERIRETIAALHEEFPAAEIVVVDGDSADGTADVAEAAGAVVVHLARKGKGEALSAGERAAAPGPLLLCDADLRGGVSPLARSKADLAVAAFARRSGGGFGIAKNTARFLIFLRTGFAPREPLSGQRYLGERARAACFPLAPGFGCEVRMTIDALRAGLRVEEIELELDHRATGRDLPGFAHRGRQLLHALLGAGPLALNHRGQRLPLVGWTVGAWALLTRRRFGDAVAAVSMLGALDDAFSGPERGWRAHLESGRTTGVLKLLGIPLVGALATRSVSGGLLVGLSANALNLFDTKPGRALKAFLVTAPGSNFAPVAILLLPYDLREKSMLGDAGSNALGAVVGLNSVDRFHGRARWAVIAALAGLNLLGERRSLGALIERTPGLAWFDRLGRRP
jgi:glucosyl-3-phosphoglycerate synthase